jgi:hypothetical protein
MTIADTDYSSVIETMRGHLALGTQASATEMKLVIQVVQDAINTKCSDTNDLIVAALADITPLDATACAANGGADAAAVIAGVVTDLTAGNPTIPDYIVNVLADG